MAPGKRRQTSPTRCVFFSGCNLTYSGRAANGAEPPKQSAAGCHIHSTAPRQSHLDCAEDQRFPRGSRGSAAAVVAALVLSSSSRRSPSLRSPPRRSSLRFWGRPRRRGPPLRRSDTPSCLRKPRLPFQVVGRANALVSYDLPLWKMTTLRCS